MGLCFFLTYDVTHCDDKVYTDERSILTQYNCNNVTVKDEDSQSPFFSWKHNMFIQKREWKCTKKHCIYSIFPSLRSAAVPIPWKLLGYTLLHPDPGANWCCTLGATRSANMSNIRIQGCDEKLKCDEKSLNFWGWNKFLAHLIFPFNFGGDQF